MFIQVLGVAIGVGLSTFIGSILAYFIKDISHRTNDIILSFAAGVMLSATIFNLILPSLQVENSNVFLTCFGVLIGAFIIFIMDKFIVDKFINVNILFSTKNNNEENLKKVTLFILAIAIHNFPEGLVVGISFSNNDIGNALALAIGISLQNIPEGLITILPLLAIGVDKKKAFFIALLTGTTEVIGVVLGYFAINLSITLLPLLLSIAGGTMLYVISHDMIPETHSHGYETEASFSLIFGFLIMLVLNVAFGQI